MEGVFVANPIAAESIVDVLKQGPAPINALVQHFSAQYEGSAKQLASHLKRRLRSIPGCACALNKVWLYLPQYLTGAHVVQPVIEGGVQWLPEVMVFLNPTWTTQGSITVLTDRGKKFRVPWRKSFWSGPSMSQEWAVWMHDYADDFGYDAFDIHCVDGLRRIFTMQGTHWDGVDRTESDAQLRSAAKVFIARHQSSVRPQDIAYDVMTCGVYHNPIAPHALIQVLCDPDPLIRLTWSGFSLAPSIPPQVRRLLDTQDPEWAVDDDTYRLFSGGLPMPKRAFEPAPAVLSGNYVIKAEMVDQAVTRVIKISARCTFTDLHYALIDSIDFDDGHLWMFSLLGSPGDPLAGVGPENVDGLPLNSDEITLGEALAVGQTYFYLFDFGDEWQFCLTVLDYLPDEDNVSPTVVAREGSDPVQYPSWEDDWDET
jgi:hypothetical protein